VLNPAGLAAATAGASYHYLAGEPIAAVLESLDWPLEPDAPATQGPIEEAVLDLLDGTHT